MILRKLVYLAAVLPFSWADVQFTSPSAGDTVTGVSLDITWKDSGKSPKISDLVSYQIFLCAGGNSANSFLQLATLITTGNFAEGSETVAAFSSTIGGNVKNAYFLKIISAATGGVVINYSDRFSLPSMTGVFPQTVLDGLKTVSGTSGPPTENQVANPQNQNTAGTGVFATPYAMQTGAIRYAPMPSIPGSKITAKGASRQYPASSYSVYTTKAGPAEAQGTVTQGQPYKVSSRENPATAAGQPNDAAMQRFLERWKD